LFTNVITFVNKLIDLKKQIIATFEA
jgi:hypothetical protein